MAEILFTGAFFATVLGFVIFLVVLVAVLDIQYFFVLHEVLFKSLRGSPVGTTKQSVEIQLDLGGLLRHPSGVPRNDDFKKDLV
jgi:hypothetical protein